MGVCFPSLGLGPVMRFMQFRLAVFFWGGRNTTTFFWLWLVKNFLTCNLAGDETSAVDNLHNCQHRSDVQYHT